MIRKAFACIALVACGHDAPAPVVCPVPTTVGLATASPAASEVLDAAPIAQPVASAAPAPRAKPTTVVTVAPEVGAVAIDDTGMYGVLAGALLVYGLDGSGPRTLAKNFIATNGILLGGSFIVGIGIGLDPVAQAKGDVVIDVVSKGGGPVKTIATIPRLARADVDDTFVYFSTYDGTLWKMPRAGGAQTMLYARKPRAKDLKYDDFLIALDSTDVYFGVQKSAAEPGSIRAVAKSGGGARVVVHGVSTWGMHVDGGYVYWEDDSDTMHVKLFRAPKSGGAATELLSGPLGSWLVDGASIVYSRPGTNGGAGPTPPGVFVMPVGGGASVEIAADRAFGIARAKGALYWMGDLGVVRRLER